VTKTINPGLYLGGMSIEAGAAIDFAPGAYYVINGDFSVACNAMVTCRTCDGTGGVIIVLTTTTASAEAVGKVQIQPGAAAGALRIGAEYARFHPADKLGIQNAVASAMSFGPPLTCPIVVSQTCECAMEAPSPAPPRARRRVAAGPIGFFSGSAQVKPLAQL